MPKTTALGQCSACIALVLCILAGQAGITAYAEEAAMTRPPNDPGRTERAIVHAPSRAAVPPGFAADMIAAYEDEVRKGRSLEEAKQAVGARRGAPVDRAIRSEIDATLRAQTAGADTPR